MPIGTIDPEENARRFKELERRRQAAKRIREETRETLNRNALAGVSFCVFVMLFGCCVGGLVLYTLMKYGVIR